MGLQDQLSTLPTFAREISSSIDDGTYIVTSEDTEPASLVAEGPEYEYFEWFKTPV